jgi:hypothetical protein
MQAEKCLSLWINLWNMGIETEGVSSIGGNAQLSSKVWGALEKGRMPRATPTSPGPPPGGGCPIGAHCQLKVGCRCVVPYTPTQLRSKAW